MSCLFSLSPPFLLFFFLPFLLSFSHLCIPVNVWVLFITFRGTEKQYSHSVCNFSVRLPLLFHTKPPASLPSCPFGQFQKNTKNKQWIQLVQDSAINRVCDDALGPLHVLQAIVAGAAPFQLFSTLCLMPSFSHFLPYVSVTLGLSVEC